jgi:hypothetical protein
MFLSGSAQMLCASALAWACAPAAAQAINAATGAATQHQRDRATCLSGLSPQDRTTCLRESDAALVARRTGTVPEDAESLERNAQRRCDAFANQERAVCVSRVIGQGTTSGSVAGGGILRELVITEPDKARAEVPTADTPVQPRK